MGPKIAKKQRIYNHKTNLREIIKQLEASKGFSRVILIDYPKLGMTVRNWMIFMIVERNL